MSSSILSAISKIRKTRVSTTHKIENPALHDYKIIFDEYRRKLYINAKVYPDSLDNGEDITEQGISFSKKFGDSDRDLPQQYIHKKLGGDGLYRNVFPLNSKIDISSWLNAQDSVYKHIKEKPDRHADLQYGINYDSDATEHFGRPFDIYYFYVLYENGKAFGEPLEGVIEN
uniref:Uncharacterized protein n=1 Tax=Panagrolaimus davidi TaxID=227884 RepID=A0A914PTH8_9BILA